MAGKSYMKKKRETIEEKALKLQKKFLTLADTKGTISEKEMEYVQPLQFITSKPVLYVCNVDENSALSGNEYTKKIDEYAKENNSEVLLISAKIESEISQISDMQDKQDFLESLGLKETGLKRVIKKGYEILNYINYFTAGEKELRAWTIIKGTFAPSAAGTIHSDMEKGFIRAETISYDDYIANNGEAGAKEKGKLRLEGKEYEVKDGDVMHFLFNV